uniref:Uncharacterized protein n=1 Tax=Rhodosorus marinus TaxID=101924 RepID=A0A7S2ZAS6_9RHOD
MKFPDLPRETALERIDKSDTFTATKKVAGNTSEHFPNSRRPVQACHFCAPTLLPINSFDDCRTISCKHEQTRNLQCQNEGIRASTIRAMNEVAELSGVLSNGQGKIANQGLPFSLNSHPVALT